MRGRADWGRRKKDEKEKKKEKGMAYTERENDCQFKMATNIRKERKKQTLLLEAGLMLTKSTNCNLLWDSNVRE